MNHAHLWGNVYLVWTQAGFTQALYKTFGATEKYAPAYGRNRLRASVNNYPREYPSIVSFEDHMFEQDRVFVFCKPAHKVTAILKENGIDLYPEN